MLGAPVVTVEVHQDQIFESIAIACEMFTKYAGYTREYLVFNSALYQRGKGIRLDHLYTLANPNLTLENRAKHDTQSRDTAPYLDLADAMYVCTSAVDASLMVSSTVLSAAFVAGIRPNQILDASTYNTLLSTVGDVSMCFTPSVVQRINARGNCDPVDSPVFNNMFDYDLMDYRKVIDITSFEEGSTTGINTLFTIEQTLAQQTYFSYAMGNYGFDLVSWHILKDWLETREKMLATKRSIEFNDRTQYLRMYPEPTPNQIFFGVLSCYIEKPLRDIIKEAWVYQYALALTKIVVGGIRTKIPVNMFGGNTFSSDLAAQGLQEKAKLEEQLFTNAAAFGDADPVIFSIG